MFIKITASPLILIPCCIFNINWKHLWLMSLALTHKANLSCVCSNKLTFLSDSPSLVTTLTVCLGAMIAICISEYSIIKYAFIQAQWNIFLYFLFFFFYRILSHNKIRVLRNGSFFGLHALERLWVFYFLSSFTIYKVLQMLQYHVCVYIRFMWCIHVWCIILACAWGFAEKYSQGYHWDLRSSVCFYWIMGFWPAGRMIRSDWLSQSYVEKFT